jgi:hypothetical protein
MKRKQIARLFPRASSSARTGSNRPKDFSYAAFDSTKKLVGFYYKEPTEVSIRFFPRGEIADQATLRVFESDCQRDLKDPDSYVTISDSMKTGYLLAASLFQEDLSE